ncbi:Sulfhydryl oxidase 1 [Trifolium repens]|nr:Sulfhydryl oxidase 1 [Trifolium repens]
MKLFLGLFLCAFSVCCSSSATFSGPRRSILREVNDKDQTGADHDYAVELNATNFDSVLKDTPATFAVVEFFAHWLVLFIFINQLSILLLLL